MKRHDAWQSGLCLKSCCRCRRSNFYIEHITLACVWCTHIGRPWGTHIVKRETDRRTNVALILVLLLYYTDQNNTLTCSLGLLHLHLQGHIICVPAFLLLLYNSSVGISFSSSLFSPSFSAPSPSFLSVI